MKNQQNLDKNLTDFDADLSPDNPINNEAAEQRGLRYDSKNKGYRDSDGCPIRDKYGQPLG